MEIGIRKGMTKMAQHWVNALTSDNIGCLLAIEQVFSSPATYAYVAHYVPDAS
jgi:hypothetical protein